MTAGPALGAILDALALESLGGGRAVVSAPAAHAALARSRAGQLEAAFTAALGEPVRVEVRPAESAAEGARAPDSEEASAAMEHPLVKQAMDVFDARVVRVDAAAETRPGAEEEPP